MPRGLGPDFPYHSKFRGLWMSSLSSAVPRRLSFHLCAYHGGPGECSTDVCWIKWWMNKWGHKKWGWRQWLRQKGVNAEGSLSLCLKKRIPRVCSSSPVLSTCLMPTVQAFLILKPQALIFSLSKLVLLNSYLPFAQLGGWLLTDPFVLQCLLDSFLLLILRHLSYPQTWCLSPPSILVFRILLKDSSFPYWFPHDPGNLLSFPSAAPQAYPGAVICRR